MKAYLRSLIEEEVDLGLRAESRRLREEHANGEETGDPPKNKPVTSPASPTTTAGAPVASVDATDATLPGVDGQMPSAGPDGTVGSGAPSFGGAVGGGTGVALDNPETGTPGLGGSEPSPDGSTEAEEEPADPVDATMKTATDTAEKTKDIPKILKAVKAGIQNKFATPSEALPLVQQLKASSDPALKAVAHRLEQYLKSS